MNSTKYDSMFKGNWKTKIVQSQRSSVTKELRSLTWQNNGAAMNYERDSTLKKDMRRFSHGNTYIDSENL